MKQQTLESVTRKLTVDEIAAKWERNDYRHRIYLRNEVELNLAISKGYTIFADEKSEFVRVPYIEITLNDLKP